MQCYFCNKTFTFLQQDQFQILVVCCNPKQAFCLNCLFDPQIIENYKFSNKYFRCCNCRREVHPDQIMKRRLKVRRQHNHNNKSTNFFSTNFKTPIIKAENNNSMSKMYPKSMISSSISRSSFFTKQLDTSSSKGRSNIMDLSKTMSRFDQGRLNSKDLEITKNRELGNRDLHSRDYYNRNSTRNIKMEIQEYNELNNNFNQLNIRQDDVHNSPTKFVRTNSFQAIEPVGNRKYIGSIYNPYEQNKIRQEQNKNKKQENFFNKMQLHTKEQLNRLQNMNKTGFSMFNRGKSKQHQFDMDNLNINVSKSTFFTK